MTIAAQAAARVDFYDSARQELETTIAKIQELGACSHRELETSLREGVGSIGQRLMQGHMDALFEAEQAQVAYWVCAEGSEVRVRSRSLETRFGRVTVRRHGYKERGQTQARFALDGALNLPPEVYSLGLRREVAEEAVDVSFGRTVERVDQTTSGHVPKRQAEQLVERAATDFDAFYTGWRAPANDTLSAQALQVLSSDSKGVTMRPQALRDATRKQAEAAQADSVRGDPMAQRKARRSDKRMAIVTAVWEQEPHERTAQDIVQGLKRKPRAHKPSKRAKAKMPRSHDKRVWASVQKSQAQGIAEMFDEAQRRNPHGARRTLVLVDGEENQMGIIEAEAKKRTMPVTIVLDLIHVIHYLWLIAVILCRKDEKASERWVTHILGMLLTAHPLDVVAAIRQTATNRRIAGEDRDALDKYVEYLRKNSTYIHYARFLADGLPIATGVIEGACRHLIQDRLGITGARWLLASAEAVLKLRALRCSGDWDEYWSFHERQEHMRNHPDVARAA